MPTRSVGWRHEEIVSIQAGNVAREQEQLDFAVEKLMKTHGRIGSWK
jgi:hypothetical protein